MVISIYTSECGKFWINITRKSELAKKKKRGRPTESYANYIAGHLSKALKLSNVEIEAAASGPVEKACDRLHRLISLMVISVIVHPNDDDDEGRSKIFDYFNFAFLFE